MLMGSLDCFKIIGLGKGKEDRSKKAKVHSAAEKSVGCKWMHRNRKDISLANGASANGASSRSSSDLRLRLEFLAAIRIQTAFRAFKARKTLKRLKGTAKLQVSIQNHTARYQAQNTLGCIHSWCRIQAEIRARRLCMVTEGRLKQKKLENQSKLETKLHELEVEWCGGAETMEEILSRIQHREEAAVKRERAMAYAFSHQWRANASQYLGQTYYDVGKDNWGWSWMERWIAARPWEVRVHSLLPAKPIKALAKQAMKAGKIPELPATKTPEMPKTASLNGKVTSAQKKLPDLDDEKEGT